jgi:predicted MFS family arabinose efflux permease
MLESRRGKWLLLTLLCFAGAMVYTFPFLRYSYYDTMKEALGVTHTQMGLMQAVNGVAATFGYIPGGWLADRYSPRKLLATSLIVTGLSGFYFSTFPSYVGGTVPLRFLGGEYLNHFLGPFH